MELPAIMKWLKQVFARVYKFADWWRVTVAEIVEGEKTESGAEEDSETRVRPHN